MVHQAQFLAIAGRVGKGGTGSTRRASSKSGSDSGSDLDSESEEADASSELSDGLNWLNFHWLDLSHVSECLGLGDVEL